VSFPKKKYERLRHLLYHAIEGGLPPAAGEGDELDDLVTEFKVEYDDLVRERNAARRTRDRLAEQMASHAHCDDHPTSAADVNCPFCADRSAYLAYLSAGGRDYRPSVDGPSITLAELRRRTESTS
jgi:hypothetical protein